MEFMNSLARLRDGRNRRISSYDRTGGNNDAVAIEPGQTVNLAEISGAGVIRHIWCTYGHDDPMALRNMIVRMYWDGEKQPSVQAPLGDLFGQGWGENYPLTSLPLCATPKKSMVCYFPMPFNDGARIELENDSDTRSSAFYYYVDYEEHRAIGPEQGRFHAEWRRRLNRPPEGMENEWHKFGDVAKNLTDEFNHLFIDAVGRGHYVGLNYYVDSPTAMWYGEGDDMFFIDGERWPPSLHGTGTEDYFNSSYCPKVAYCAPFFGYPRVNTESGWLGRTHCYRFHLPDPVMFSKSLRGSIECGHANCLTLDLTTVAYWYQTEPHKPFAAMANRAGRANMPVLTLRELHYWRETWRQLQGGAPWGNEPLPEKFVRKLRARIAAPRKRMAPPEAARRAAQELEARDRMLNRRGPKAAARGKPAKKKRG